MLDAAAIIDASLLPAALIALAAGVLSFLSPCVLPIVPPYLAYMGGISVREMEERRGPVIGAAVFFVLGLSTVFLLLGAAFSALGRLFLQWQDWFVIGAGLVIIVFGLHFLHLFRLPFLDREARIDAGEKGGSAFGAYVLGLAFAFGWTPCLGPVLGAILGLAAGEASLARGTALLAAYALGLGLPFIAVAIFFPSLKGLMARMRRHMGLIERISGGLLVIVGLAMVTGQFTAFAWWLLETFPALGRIG